jgi:hypothetical protein
VHRDIVVPPIGVGQLRHLDMAPGAVGTPESQATLVCRAVVKVVLSRPVKFDNVKSGAWLPIGNAIFYLLTCKLSTRQTLAGCRLAVSDFYTNA